MPENSASNDSGAEYQSPAVETPETEEQKQERLKDEKVMDIVTAILPSAITYWDGYCQKYQRLENLYFGNVREDSPVRDLQSQLSSGDAFELVETVLPRMIANKIRPALVGVEEGDKNAAKLNEQILDFQIETQYLEKPIEDWIRQAVKTVGGLQVDCETTEVKQYRKQRKYSMRIPFTQKTFGVGPMIEVVQVKKIFRHILETIPYEDLVVPPGTSTDTLPFIGRKVKRKAWKLKEDGGYKNLDKLKEFLAQPLMEGDNSDQYKMSRGDQQGVNWAVVDPIVLDMELNLVELYMEVEGVQHKVCVHPDSMLILRNEPLNLWHGMNPIRLLSTVPVENQAIGLSTLESAEAMIDSMDVWINVLLQTAMFDVNRGIAYDKKAIGIDWRKNPPKYEPGMVTPFNGNPNNGMAVLPAPKIDASHQWVTNFMKTRLQNLTGVTDYIAGGDNVKQDQTLGAIQLKTAQSIKRFELSAKNIRREISKIFFMMVSNNQQFMPDDYPVRILGKMGAQYKKVDSESIQGSFDYRVRGYESIATEEAEVIARYRAMLADAANPLVRPFINIEEVVRGLFLEGYKVDAGSKMLISSQERLQAEDQAKQQQAMDANSENMDPQTAVVRPDDNHAVHLDIHQAFLTSPAFKQLPPQLQEMLARHIDAHRKLMGAAGEQGQAGGPNALQPAAPVSDLVPPSESQYNPNQQ